jgi:hypothetical protein
MAIYKEGLDYDIVAFDARRQARPEWAAAFRQRPLRVRGLRDARGADRPWLQTVRALGTMLEHGRRPYALASIVVGPIETATNTVTRQTK